MHRNTSRLNSCLLALCLVPVILLSASAQADNDINSIRITSLLGLDTILISQVDVVFVYDEEVARALPATKGDWYSLVDELPDAYTAQMDILTTDIPQGFYAQNLVLPERSGEAVSVFAVAYHQSLSTPVSDLTSLQQVLIQIDEFGILISEQN